MKPPSKAIAAMTADEREQEAQRYVLSQEESQRIFDRKIKPRFLDPLKSQPNPKVELLGGQPAAGKSGLLRQKELELAQQGGSVTINGDEFRRFHPRNDEIKRQHGKDSAFYTDKDSARWIEQLIQETQKRKINVILEGTMRRPEVTVKTAEAYRDSGFEVNASIMATHPAQSWLRVHQRYEHGLTKNPDDARFTQKHSHDVAVTGVRETVKAIEAHPAFRSLTLYQSDQGQVSTVYHNQRHGQTGEWVRAPQGYLTLTELHQAKLSRNQQVQLDQGWQKITDQMRERGAPRSDIQQVIKDQYPKTEPARAGRTYNGVVVNRDEDRTIQRTATGKLIIHETDKLDGLEQGDAGKNKSISYAKGNDRATVTDNSQSAKASQAAERSQESTKAKKDNSFER